jgi:hypothetical protein
VSDEPISLQPAYAYLDALAILVPSLLPRRPESEFNPYVWPKQLTARHNEPMTADLCAISAGPSPMLMILFELYGTTDHRDK